MEAIEELATRQSLVLSRRQLRTAGWSRFQIDHEIEIGRRQSPAPAVVVLHTGTLDGNQPLWVGVLHAGDGSVLSHLTAACRAGLKWSDPPLIDVMTPRGDAVIGVARAICSTRRDGIRTVGKQGKRRYLDCVWVLPDGRVIVLEVDGSFHAEVIAWWTDMKRERAVVVQGDTVLRCSSI
jgi:hypothetical protein